jgi:hypothetical protein
MVDISDLGLSFNFDRIYNDACDVGLILVSDKTGDAATFYLHDVVKEDGDVIYWFLLPTSETIREFPRLKTSKIKIWND